MADERAHPVQLTLAPPQAAPVHRQNTCDELGESADSPLRKEMAP